MRRNVVLLFAAWMTLAASTACTKSETEETPKSVQTPAQAPAMIQPAATQRSGKVVETINTGDYTYVQVDTGSEKIWAAAPTFEVQVGDNVLVPQGVPMTDYYSKTLDRTFDLVYFVSSVTVGGAAPAGGPMPEGHPTITSSDPGAPTVAAMDFSAIKKPEGGKTVSELFGEKAALTGKPIVVRGKVVKFSAGIMGKNWIHLEDGTGDQGTNNLTVTTDATAKVGDTVLVNGVLVTDKDYGYGYHYDVIVENAQVVIE